MTKVEGHQCPTCGQWVEPPMTAERRERFLAWLADPTLFTRRTASVDMETWKEEEDVDD